MAQPDRLLLFGNEAVAHAARNAGVMLGTGYPGTPSTEILETFSDLGGHAQWAPNEKVALEVALGASYCGARTLVTMKHVGVNVAADPLFTAAYTGVDGALILVSADDPGMHSSQNEQDNRYYALAAGIPMLEPADAQDAYDFTNSAIEMSERWHLPVMLRMTTRVCHTKSVVRPRWLFPPLDPPRFQRKIRERVMIPAYARPAHQRLRQKLAEIEAFSNTCACHREYSGNDEIGIVTAGVTFLHVREAAPDASILKLGCTHPVPVERVRQFANKVKRCFVIEEGEPYLTTLLRAAGIPVESKPDIYRFGELNVDRVRKILAGDTSPEPLPAPGKLPELCKGCPYRPVYDILHRLDCIVAGDIGCYTLGVLPPYEAMDTCVCMGASITVGLGMRHVLPPDQARRVVSVIGDSTFVHTGIPGLVEMVYNPPPTGHVVIVLDNGTTAMTGQQEHPATGRSLDHAPTNQIKIEEVARAIGVGRVHVADPTRDPAAFEQLLVECLNSRDLCFVVARHCCILAAPSIREYERRANQEFDYQCVPGGTEKHGE